MNKNHDDSLETLIGLGGYIVEIGERFWVKIEVRIIEQSEDKPFGIKYSLIFHNPMGERSNNLSKAYVWRSL